MSALRYQTLYENELIAILKDNIEHTKEKLAAGMLDSLEEYKYLAGKIAGLRSAMEAMDEATTICNHKAR